MTEQDIKAQLDASLSKVHVAFARVKQAVVDDDTLSALEGMADAIAAIGAFAAAATRAVEVVGQQRDAARAEVDRLRAWMPTWKRGSHGRGLWSIGAPNARKKLQVWQYDGKWYWAFSDGWEQPAPNRDAAMRDAEAALGLPQCEVCDEP